MWICRSARQRGHPSLLNRVWQQVLQDALPSSGSSLSVWGRPLSTIEKRRRRMYKTSSPLWLPAVLLDLKSISTGSSVGQLLPAVSPIAAAVAVTPVSAAAVAITPVAAISTAATAATAAAVAATAWAARGALLLEAVAAIDGPVFTWNKRDRCCFAAGGADRLVLLTTRTCAGKRVATAGFATFRAAAGGVGQALAGKKLLFAGSKCEFLTAVTAGKDAVLVALIGRHR